MMPMRAVWGLARMGRRWSLWAALAMMLCLSACAWVPQRQLHMQQQAALKVALSKAAAAVDVSDAAGYTVRVHAQGQLLFAKDAGLASLDLRLPINEQTVFELASLSKSFTAVAVMQLQERGLIELDQALSYYLPDVPKNWGAITVHQLLSHQSGLPDELNQWPRSRFHALDFQGLLQHVSAQPQLDFEPGSQAAYSNLNYMVLAQLVQEVSGQSFADYLKTHVFEPAGMRSSSVLYFAPEQLMQQALSYGEAVQIHGIDYALAGAIGQKGSMEDLVHFMQALLSHRLLRAESLDLMMMPQTLFADGKRYGYGWYLGQLGGWASLSTTQPAAGAGHTGRLGAYRTALYFNRQRDFQFIMLSNGGASTEVLLADLLKMTRNALE